MSRWFEEVKNENSSIVASRIRLARNWEEYRFPGSLTPEEAREMISRLKKELRGLPDQEGKDCEYLDLERMPDLERRALRERRLINRSMAEKKTPGGLILSDDERISLMLNGDDHYAYIQGYSDGSVRPNANITRAQVATIFFRLLTDEARAEYLTETSPFHDVAPDAWYATAVATMEAMGIVEGRAPAVFDPEAPITRGEFAAIAARFDSAPYDGADRFTDIGGHWAAEYINQAAVKGWVEGQPDGSFAPDRSISRAEAMTLVNRVLGRLPETADDLLDGMITWPDNPPGAWYYLAVQEATNSHDYGRKADTVHETWTGLQPVEDWTRYEQ